MLLTQIGMMLCCRHSSAMGSVMAGSAFCARNTCFARPLNSAFFSCFAPTTTLQQVKSGKLPHFGILLSFLVSIQKHIIRTFSKKSTRISEFSGKFPEILRSNPCSHNLLLYRFCCKTATEYSGDQKESLIKNAMINRCFPISEDNNRCCCRPLEISGIPEIVSCILCIHSTFARFLAQVIQQSPHRRNPQNASPLTRRRLWRITFQNKKSP